MKVTREPNPDPKTQPLYYWCALMERYMPVRAEMKPSPDFPMYRIEPPDEARAARKKFTDIPVGNPFEWAEKTRRCIKVNETQWKHPDHNNVYTAGAQDRVIPLPLTFADLEISECFRWTKGNPNAHAVKLNESLYRFESSTLTAIYDATQSYLKNSEVERIETVLTPCSSEEVIIGDYALDQNGVAHIVSKVSITASTAKGYEFTPFKRVPKKK